MTFGTYVWAISISAVFAGWPVLARWAGTSGAWMGTLVMFGSALITAACSSRQLIDGPVLTMKVFWILLGLGALNGLAVYIYSIKAADPEVPIGVFLMTIFILMIVEAPLIEWIFNNKMELKLFPFRDIRSIAGLFLSLGGVYLLSAPRS